MGNIALGFHLVVALLRGDASFGTFSANSPSYVSKEGCDRSNMVRILAVRRYVFYFDKSLSRGGDIEQVIWMAVEWGGNPRKKGVILDISSYRK